MEMIQTKSKMPKWMVEQVEMSKYVGKRKHSSQLTNKEIDSLHRRLEEVNKWEMSHHTLQRIVEKSIRATYDDIVSTIVNCDIIEYKIDYNGRRNRCEERVVVRSRALTNRNYNLNVVYNITNQKVITVWLNHVDDKHDTLDWSIYDRNMKVFGVR